MGRKPKLEPTQLHVVVDAVPYAVSLYPPAGKKASWYCYWAGLPNGPRSTGAADLGPAKAKADAMIRTWLGGGDAGRPRPDAALLTDQEFEAVQRAHFTRRADPRGAARSAKSLKDTLEAVRAFKAITGLDAIARATPDHCARFQTEALKRAKNWRQDYDNSKEDQPRISANTVLKWSRTLQAAFERVNRSNGKKWVRGEVNDDRKFIDANPWLFPWRVEGVARPKRQLSPQEITDLLVHLAGRWAGVPVAAAAVKVFLWSGCRREEVAGLGWDQYRPVGDEHHFEVEGKRGVRRWFRVPGRLFTDLQSFRVEGDCHVFAAYNPQLRAHHAAGERPWQAGRVGAAFDPECFGDWLYNRVVGWAKGSPGGHAHLHIFRKTSLQHAREGDAADSRVAEDASVGKAVLLGHYVSDTDGVLRQRSNRHFARLVSAFDNQVSKLLGHEPPAADPLEGRLKAAVAVSNWDLAARLSQELARRPRTDAGGRGAREIS